MEGQYKYILILYRTGLRRLKISDGQEHFKAYNAVCAGGGYTAFMQFHNFLGYGRPSPAPPVLVAREESRR